MLKPIYSLQNNNLYFFAANFKEIWTQKYKIISIITIGSNTLLNISKIFYFINQKCIIYS